MRIPSSPPSVGKLFEDAQARGRLEVIFAETAARQQASPGRYLHWEELRRRTPPGDSALRSP